MPHNLNYPSLNAIKEFNKITVTERNEVYSLEEPQTLERILERMREIGEEIPLDQAIVKKAAKLLHGITLLQPFYEGNKETALAATKAFLALNGYGLYATNEELFVLLTSIVYGSQDLNSVEQFLILHVRKI